MTGSPTPTPPPNPPPKGPLADLVPQAVAGQPLALEKLLMVFHERLSARVERRLPSDVRAVCSTEDILQEAYSEAFRDVAGFTSRPGQDAGESFFRWLATIADHRVVDAVRSLRAAKRGGHRQVDARAPVGQTSMAPLIELLAVDSNTPSRDARGNELEGAIRAAIAGLYPAYREALELRYLLGLSPVEVAERMGRSEDAVHKLCGRAIGALRESLGDMGRYLSRE